MSGNTLLEAADSRPNANVTQFRPTKDYKFQIEFLQNTSASKPYRVAKALRVLQMQIAEPCHTPENRGGKKVAY